MPAHIGTFGFAPPHKPTQKQTPKEPILPTRFQNVEKNLIFFRVNKMDFITFDTVVKKIFSR